jgi:hypothetical protein
MDEVISYVISNPVEAGLVDEWQEWPWTGGQLVEDRKLV